MVLYAIKFNKNGTKDVCNKEDLEKIIEKSLIEQIDQPEKFKFIIELQTFMNMCYEMNSILSKFGYFLRVFELKNKFRHLAIKDKTQQKIVRQLSIKRQFDKINPIQKLRYESQNPINWQKDKCAICKFPMKLEATNHLTPDNKMTFGDFVIRDKHKFLRNIYMIEQIKQSDQIKNLESYYEIFQEYIQICIGLLALLNNFNRHNFINYATETFVEERFLGDDITGIKNTINQTEIKNALMNSRGSVLK